MNIIGGGLVVAAAARRCDLHVRRKLDVDAGVAHPRRSLRRVAVLLAHECHAQDVNGPFDAAHPLFILVELDDGVQCRLSMGMPHAVVSRSLGRMCRLAMSTL